MPVSQNSRANRAHQAIANRSKCRRRSLAAALSIMCLVGASGCSTSASLRSLASSGTWNDTVETLRNRSYSAKAYYRRQHNFCNYQHSKDFQAGFRAGYEAIADGKPGCPPAFPPKEYWSWEFQSAEGQARTAAWFEGFPHGVQAAREDGVNQWSHLQSSSKCGCNSPTPTGQCGCGHCGTGNGQIMEGYPVGSMPMGNNMPLNSGGQFYQSEIVEGHISSPSDHDGTPAYSSPATSPVIRQDNVAPSPFPVIN